MSSKKSFCKPSASANEGISESQRFVRAAWYRIMGSRKPLLVNPSFASSGHWLGPRRGFPYSSELGPISLPM